MTVCVIFVQGVLFAYYIFCSVVDTYRIYSNKRRGACLIFRVSAAALIRRRCLFNLLTATVTGKRKREVGLVVLAKFTAFTQEPKNAKILKRELNERASIYTHFELKNITIDESKFPLLA